MPRHAKLLLNKVINENDTQALVRHNVTLADMPSDIDRATLRFVEEYADDNRGQAPSYAVVADNVMGFEYVPEVSDSFEYLTKRTKSISAKRQVLALFESGEFERKLNELDGHTFVDSWLPSVIESVKVGTSVRKSIGTDVKTDGDKFLAEYERRKSGESFNVWKSKFSSVGEYVSGNMYVLFGESGRGKSIYALEDAINVAKQGAKVLIWAMEMGWYEVMVRIYTSISGDMSVMKAWHDGQQIDAGFNARNIRVGEMGDEVEEAFKAFLGNINEIIPGNIIVRGVDDADFSDRSLRALQADIEITGADYIVVDPFYYLHYEKNTSRTTGGDAANTSQMLRALTGRLDVVVVALTQSDVKKSEDSEDGTRELKLPNRDEVRKTAALMEDAAVLIGIDSDYKQGNGIVGNMKGRDGGEGDVSNVTYLPQFGIVKELEVGKDAASAFNF